MVERTGDRRRAANRTAGRVKRDVGRIDRGRYQFGFFNAELASPSSRVRWQALRRLVDKPLDRHAATSFSDPVGSAASAS
jgi:hypothetical protein